LGRLTKVTDVQGNETSFSYDEAGNKLSQTDAEGRTTSWRYNAQGQVLTRTLPVGQVETFSYNKTGTINSHTDFNGDIKTYSYDINNRVTAINYSKDGSSDYFSYDALGNKLTATNAQGRWVYTYDALN
jgi:YD repeat-containing protein